MSETTVEVLKLLGYPLGSVLTLVVLAYLTRQFFQKLLESVVARDLEAFKSQNSQNLEEIRKEHNLVLESRKSELAQETERLKTLLSVEAETHRLAAQKRFEVLLELWQSSESLLQSTDFSKADSIKTSLLQVDESLAHLRRSSVLLSHVLLEAVKVYLEETLKVLTSSEEELQSKDIDLEKSKKISELVTNSISLSIPIVGTILSTMLVPSTLKLLEKYRRAHAEKARVNLEQVIRKEFGIQSAQLASGSEDEANKSIQPTADASAD